MESVVSGVFLMEQAESLTELESLVEELEEILDDRELEEDIALLVASVAGKLAPTDAQGGTPQAPPVQPHAF